MELHIRGVSKTYASGVQALKDVTLTISAGMYGLLGPNGAGKSTLMRMIATLQEPDTGTITLGGIDVVREKDEVRKMLGYLPQEFGVYPKAPTLLGAKGFVFGTATGAYQGTVRTAWEPLVLVAHGFEPTRTRAHGRVNREHLAEIDLHWQPPAQGGVPMARERSGPPRNSTAARSRRPEDDPALPQCHG